MILQSVKQRLLIRKRDLGPLLSGLSLKCLDSPVVRIISKFCFGRLVTKCASTISVLEPTRRSYSCKLNRSYYEYDGTFKRNILSFHTDTMHVIQNNYIGASWPRAVRNSVRWTQIIMSVNSSPSSGSGVEHWQLRFPSLHFKIRVCEMTASVTWFNNHVKTFALIFPH